MNGVLQDRLVKELRLAGISSANRFLEGKYLQAFHRRFGREAASPVDVHRAVPRNLNEVLSWERTGGATLLADALSQAKGRPRSGPEPVRTAVEPNWRPAISFAASA